jgi:hypothetical protein
MLAKLKMPAVLLSGFLMTACGTAGLEINGPTDTSCRSFKIIRAANADTADTKRQVIAHNRAYLAICPQPTPGSAPSRVATNG